MYQNNLFIRNDMLYGRYIIFCDNDHEILALDTNNSECNIYLWQIQGHYEYDLDYDKRLKIIGIDII